MVSIKSAMASLWQTERQGRPLPNWTGWLPKSVNSPKANPRSSRL
jgi:hypothetical protein